MGTSQGHTDGKTSELAPEKKPWLLPGNLINSLSGKTDPRNKYTLFIGTRLHGLSCSAKGFRAAEDFYLDVFLKHRWFNGNSKRDKTRYCKHGMLLFAMSKTLVVKHGFRNLTRLALSLRLELQPVLNLSCIGCLVRQGSHASHGVNIALL